MTSTAKQRLQKLRRYGPETVLLILAFIICAAYGWFWGSYAVGTVILFALGRHLLLDEPRRRLRLQSSQSFTLGIMDQVSLSPEVLYQASVSLTVHSDALSWNRLYTLLTANSITLLTWATIFVSQLPNTIRGQVSFFMALPGLILSTAWAPFGSRNRRLHRRWADFYAELERKAGLPGPGVAAEALSYLAIEERCKTGYLVIAVPLAFADVFLFVSLRSLFQWKGW